MASASLLLRDTPIVPLPWIRVGAGQPGAASGHRNTFVAEIAFAAHGRLAPSEPAVVRARLSGKPAHQPFLTTDAPHAAADLAFAGGRHLLFGIDTGALLAWR